MRVFKVTHDANFNPRSLTGATETLTDFCKFSSHFNPRSLTGATLWIISNGGVILFQSTLPYGSDGQFLFLQFLLFVISIHAPLRERHRAAKEKVEAAHFNPRSLTGATMLCVWLREACDISIHAPLRERPMV